MCAGKFKNIFLYLYHHQQQGYQEHPHHDIEAAAEAAVLLGG